MVSRKRAREEMEETTDVLHEPSLLDKLRNMWEFSCLMQYIFIFGKAVKIEEDFDIEDLETACLTPGPSEKLAEIGLCLLKFVSSHRGLTPEIFDEYTRRQFVAKAPARNPYVTEEEPKKFADFDTFQKIRVLHQLSIWTLGNADRMRERMPEQKEIEQTQWRIEEVGYDRDDRQYYVLDDNRLYRRTDPPIPPPVAAKPKANSKKAQAARRASKRRRVSTSTPEADLESIKGEGDEGQRSGVAVGGDTASADTFGGYKWECIAITLPQYQEFIESIGKSKDPDEKILRQRLTEDVLPIIGKVEEEQQKKIARRQKELMNLEKLVGAKRSSRLAGKIEKEKEEQAAAEAVRKHAADLAAAHKEQERHKNMEEERHSRMMTREQRIKDREYKRLLHEEELAKMAEESKKIEAGEGRGSERRLKAAMEKRKKELEELAQEDEWVFDCSGCGVHGKNIDDGSHSVACEKCNVWQHSKCLGIKQVEAEKEDFHLVCKDCKRREEEAKRPKIPPLKFRVGASSSPPGVNGFSQHGSPQKFQHVAVPPAPQYTRPLSSSPTMNGYGQTPVSQYVNGSMGRPQQAPMSSTNERMASSPTSVSFHVPPNPSAALSNNQSPYLQSTPPLHYSPPTGPPRAPLSPSRPPTTAQNATTLTGAQNLEPSRQAFPQQHDLQHSFPRPLYGGPGNSPAHNPPYPRQRPSSSQSNHSNGALTSPVLNRPSMSPTQGNRDVGPLAFPPGSAASERSFVGSPFQHHERTPNAYSAHSPSLQPRQYTPTPHKAIQHHAPGLSPMAHMSGLSPTKHSPLLPQPAEQNRLANSSGSVGAGHPMSILPVAALEPSPKMLQKTPMPSVPPKWSGAAELERVNKEVEGIVGDLERRAM